jgi:hypothetical protein
MRKIVGILILFVSMVILGTAMNQGFINKIKTDKYIDHIRSVKNDRPGWYYELFVQSDRWHDGDLYGLCYLHPFKQQLEPFKLYPAVIREPATNRILYIIGDSYLADKTLNGAVAAFDDVIYLDRRFPFGPIILDTTKQNYLLMEFAERNLPGYSLQKTGEVIWKANDVQAKKNLDKNTAQQYISVKPVSIFERIGNIIFNKDLSRNLELMLFDNKLFTPVKEAKASFNYNLLGQLFPKEVAISTDEKRLFLNITVDTSNTESSFKFKSNQDINNITVHLDSARDYYQSIGFKKVYLSIIPNTVSLCDNKRMVYNHLLQKVEAHTDLQVISIYKKFSEVQPNQNLFYYNDAHWNPRGFDLWVDIVNRSFDHEFNVAPQP